MKKAEKAPVSRKPLPAAIVKKETIDAADVKVEIKVGNVTEVQKIAKQEEDVEMEE